jgi:molybdenum cofactor cytidylyltransferase
MSGDGASILLLAAGGSRRLGRPKQLLQVGGKSLLRRAAEEALACGCGPVTVVLGARAPMLHSELEGLALSVCVNEQWQEGLASSIRAGLQACLSGEEPPARVLIMLCDQPAVDRAFLAHLLALHLESGCAATACSVRGRAQAPAVFDAQLFGELLALRGDQGARELLRSIDRSIAAVEFPEGAIDIDATDDLRWLGEDPPNIDEKTRRRP